MPTTKNMKVIGKTAGSSLCINLTNLGNVAIANAFRNLGSWFQSIGVGARSFKGAVYSNGVAAFDAVTFSSIVAADTVTVNGVVFTGSDTASTSAQFLTGSGDTVAAASLAASINANTSTNTVVSATSALKVVTITCLEPGLIGNLCTLAISAHGSVTGANFAGGTDGTVVTLAKGL